MSSIWLNVALHGTGECQDQPAAGVARAAPPVTKTAI
jgi:hypothetical protein